MKPGIKLNGADFAMRPEWPVDIDLTSPTTSLARPRPGSLCRFHQSYAKLRTTNHISALMSGFAMVALVELQINPGTTVPRFLHVLFASCTSLLVLVYLISLLITTCILPYIEAAGTLDPKLIVQESPHESLHWYIETSWILSTIVGIFLFLIDLIIWSWVKFYDVSIAAAISATIIIFLAMFAFAAFARHFYFILVCHKYQRLQSEVTVTQLHYDLSSSCCVPSSKSGLTVPPPSPRSRSSSDV